MAGSFLTCVVLLFAAGRANQEIYKKRGAKDTLEPLTSPDWHTEKQCQPSTFIKPGGMLINGKQYTFKVIQALE